MTEWEADIKIDRMLSNLQVKDPHCVFESGSEYREFSRLDSFSFSSDDVVAPRPSV